MYQPQLILFLRHVKTTSNATRQVNYITSKWYDKSNMSRLCFRKKSRAGRSSLTGRTIIWTKSSILKRLILPKVNYNFRSREPGFVSTLRVTPFSSKLLALVVFMSGGHSYIPALDSTKMFSVVTFRAKRGLYTTGRKTSHYTLLHLARTFRKISNLELTPGKGSQYARSAGCFAKITKIDRENHVGLVKLPSGVRKFFSAYSSLLRGPSALRLKRKVTNTKSGLWRTHGLKPKVRGVARNPVDHPHGGRTKAIKYPRTPWGKTTKFK